MRKIPKIILIIFILAAGANAAWDMAYPSGSWNYRMTVAVETPEGIKTGSAVREVHGYNMPKLWQPGDSFVGVTKGEAVVVDLGKRGTLFALMNGGKEGGITAIMSCSTRFPLNV